MLKKQEIIKTIISIIVVGLLIYVCLNILNNYRTKELLQTYKNGADDVTKQIIEQSKENDCKKTVQLKLGDEKLDLIDIRCLEQKADTASQGQDTEGK